MCIRDSWWIRNSGIATVSELWYNYLTRNLHGLFCKIRSNLLWAMLPDLNKCMYVCTFRLIWIRWERRFADISWLTCARHRRTTVDVILLRKQCRLAYSYLRGCGGAGRGDEGTASVKVLNSTCCAELGRRTDRTVASPGFVARRGKDWSYLVGHSRRHGELQCRVQQLCDA